MTKRMVNKLNEILPHLGFGAMRLPCLDDGNVDMETTQKMVDYAMENGFNYFDTAWPYHDGNSELVMKEVLVNKYPRDSFFLANKMPLWECNNLDDAKRIFNKQLEKCGVEYFDFYLMHAMNKQRNEIGDRLGIYNFLQEMKEQGKIKHFGFSFHDTPDVLEDIIKNHPFLEFVQLQINYADWEAPEQQSRVQYEIAIKYGLPIIIMEPVKGGMLVNFQPSVQEIFKQANPNLSIASWAIRYAASFDEVAVVLSGMSNMEQLKDNISYMKEFNPLNDEERAVVERVREEIAKVPTIPCTACKYCIDCPQQIDIPKIFDLYNRYLKFGDEPRFVNRIKNMMNQPDTCIWCGYCTSQCPQHIDIPERLKEIADLVKEKAV